jgi:hypothetical protein
MVRQGRDRRGRARQDRAQQRDRVVQAEALRCRVPPRELGTLSVLILEIEESRRASKMSHGSSNSMPRFSNSRCPISPAEFLVERGDHIGGMPGYVGR